MKVSIFKNKSKSRGFTIIETMIAVALFLVVVMVGMDALLNANRIHQKSQDMRSVLDSLNFIMEEMSRNMRTGYNFHCVDNADYSVPTLNIAKSCSGGGAVAFESAYGNPSNDGDQWVYKVESLDSGVTFNISKSTDSGVTWVQLNPTEVIIDATSNFAVLGAEGPSTDQQQPLINIKLSGRVVLKNNVISPFSLQTSVSQRLVDIDSVAAASGPASYQYVRFNVTQTRTEPTSGCTQIAEFTLLLDGAPVAWPGGSSASVIGGIGSNQGADKAIDGISSVAANKLCNTGAAGPNPPNTPMILTVNMGTPVTFNGYKYATAGDLDSRDPITWTVEGSTDGSAWTVLSSVVSATVPSGAGGRNTYTADFNF